MNLRLMKVKDTKTVIYNNEDENSFVIQDDYSNGDVNIDLCLRGLDDYYDIINIVKDNPNFKNISLSGITDMSLKFLIDEINVNIQYAELLDGVIFIELNKNEIKDFDSKINIYRLLALNLREEVKKLQNEKGRTL